VFDSDKDSRIDYHEFRFGLRALGFDLPKPETYAYLTRYAIAPMSWPPQKECSPIWREFTLPIFQGIAGTLMYNRDPVEECQRAYRLFDIDAKGIITVEDLRRVMKEIGQSMEESELEAMVREFDADGKGCGFLSREMPLTAIPIFLGNRLTVGGYTGASTRTSSSRLC